jgi:choline dehydrogenase
VGGGGSDQEGAGLVQVSQRNGKRWTVADGFIRPALDRGNLEVRTNGRALQLRLDGPQVTRLTYERSGETD